jgi:hypothetical protein
VDVVKLIDHTGQTFSRWTVLGHAPARAGRDRAFWICRCECGTEREIDGERLRSGASRSCGCYRAKLAADLNARRANWHYQAWADIKQRCYSPYAPAYDVYGALGITVCDRWRDSFANFLEDVGERPGWATGGLDRIDPAGNYEPGNVQWATRKTQRANRRLGRVS